MIKRKKKGLSEIIEAKFRHEVKKSSTQRGGKVKPEKRKEAEKQNVEMFNPNKYQNWLA